MPLLPVFVLVLCLYQCTVCTVFVTLVKYFGIASTGNISILPCLHSFCVCTIAQCVLRLYSLYNVLAWPARAMYLSCPCLYSYCACSIAQSMYCACTSCTVFWHGQHEQGTFLARACTRLCLYHCKVCTVLVPLVQCFGMTSTGNVHSLPVVVLARTYRAYTIVQYFSMSSPGNVRILPACVIYLIARWSSCLDSYAVLVALLVLT